MLVLYMFLLLSVHTHTHLSHKLLTPAVRQSFPVASVCSICYCWLQSLQQSSTEWSPELRNSDLEYDFYCVCFAVECMSTHYVCVLMTVYAFEILYDICIFSQLLLKYWLLSSFGFVSCGPCFSVTVLWFRLLLYFFYSFIGHAFLLCHVPSYLLCATALLRTCMCVYLTPLTESHVMCLHGTRRSLSR